VQEVKARGTEKVSCLVPAIETTKALERDVGKKELKGRETGSMREVTARCCHNAGSEHVYRYGKKKGGFRKKKGTWHAENT